MPRMRIYKGKKLCKLGGGEKRKKRVRDRKVNNVLLDKTKVKLIKELFLGNDQGLLFSTIA